MTKEQDKSISFNIPIIIDEKSIINIISEQLALEEIKDYESISNDITPNYLVYELQGRLKTAMAGCGRINPFQYKPEEYVKTYTDMATRLYNERLRDLMLDSGIYKEVE